MTGSQRFDFGSFLFQSQLTRKGESLDESDLNLRHRLLASMEVRHGKVHRAKVDHRVRQRACLRRYFRQGFIAFLKLCEVRVVAYRDFYRGPDR